MQVTETKSEGLKREYSIIVSAADLDTKTTEKLTEVRKDFQMKGFRKGKAPLPLLKKMFGKSVLGEVVQETVEGSVSEHLQEQGHRPAQGGVVRSRGHVPVSEGCEICRLCSD